MKFCLPSSVGIWLANCWLNTSKKDKSSFLRVAEDSDEKTDALVKMVGINRSHLFFLLTVVCVELV